MANDDNMRRFSAQDLLDRIAGGEDRTDFSRLRAMSDADTERERAADPDFRDVPEDWHAAAEAVMPVQKRLLSLRLDAEVVEWFKQQGPGYQTRMNAALRSFMHHSMRNKVSG